MMARREKHQDLYQDSKAEKRVAELLGLRSLEDLAGRPIELRREKRTQPNRTR